MGVRQRVVREEVGKLQQPAEALLHWTGVPQGHRQSATVAGRLAVFLLLPWFRLTGRRPSIGHGGARCRCCAAHPTNVMTWTSQQVRPLPVALHRPFCHLMVTPPAPLGGLRLLRSRPHAACLVAVVVPLHRLLSLVAR